MFESLALPASEQDPALHDGGLIVPKMQAQLRLVKPPMVYWLQSLSASVWTWGRPALDAIWMYRLPSALAAMGAVILTWRLGSRIFDDTSAFVGAGVLAVSPLMIWEANQARADHLLLVATISALWALWEIRSDHSTRTWCCVWLFGSIGLGMLSKGPITPMVVLLTALTLSIVGRDWRWLLRTRPALGVVIVAGVLMLWVVPLTMRVGLGVAVEVAVRETIGRGTTVREGHWGPPGYHLFLLMFLLWPGCLLAAMAFGRTLRLAVRIPPSEDRRIVARLRTFSSRWHDRVLGRDAELFLISWIVPSWVVFELLATKLPHYTLPLYPAIALLSARAVVDASRGMLDRFSAEQWQYGLNIWFGLGVLVCAGTPIVLALLGSGIVGVSAGLLAAIGAGVLLWYARSAAFDGLLVKAQVIGVGAVLVMATVTMGVILPRASALWVNARVAELLPEGRPVACAQYYEDSLSYLTRGRIVLAEDGLKWLRENPEGILILPRTASTAELDLHRIGTVGGFNYAGGKFVLLDVVERAR